LHVTQADLLAEPRVSGCQNDPVSAADPAPVPEPVPALQPAPSRSLALLGTTAALFAIGLVFEIWGGLNFPSNAPVEQIYCTLIVFDIAAGFVVAMIVVAGGLFAKCESHTSLKPGTSSRSLR